MGDIFQEVDEDLRKDRFEQIWKDYGRYAVAAAIAIVIAVGGWKAWEFYTISERQKLSHQYEVAARLLAEGKKSDASALFAGLAKKSDGSYGLLAQLQRAAIIAEGGDISGAVSIYDQIAADSSNTQMVRDAAVLFSVTWRVDQPDANLGELKQRLQPLIDRKSQWRFSAAELTGVIALREGDRAAARKVFQGLADDPDAPPSMRARATQILTVLGKS